MVPRTSQRGPAPTYPRHPLTSLFDHREDVPKWRPGNPLIWRPRDVPRRLIWDVPRTFSGHSQEIPKRTFKTCLRNDEESAVGYLYGYDPLILSRNIIWHVIGRSLKPRFSGWVYSSYVLYMLRRKNGLTNN